MNHSFITTVGTSLLTNNKDDRPWAGRSKQDPLPSSGEMLHWLKSCDPARASAELNTLSKLEIQQGDSVVFLHSSTIEGELCAETLGAFARNRWEARTALKQVSGLDYQGGTQAARGLRALSSLLLESIREAESISNKPLLCATGGFKSEIAFCNLVGMLTSTDVYYIHELSQELVRLPPLPVREDISFFKQHEATIAWLEEEPRNRHEAHSRLSALPQLAELVDEAEDGNVYLNPAASLLYRYFVASNGGPMPTQWPTESNRLPRDKNQISSEEHHRPQGWESILDKLCRHPYVDTVRYCNFQAGGILHQRPPSAFIANYKRGEEAMGFLVETTATNAAQLERITNHIRRTILS